MNNIQGFADSSSAEIPPGNPPRRGIYLVANQPSAEEAHNLIYSIRECGCRLPIHVIPYGGKPFHLGSVTDGVRLLSLADFPSEGVKFVQELEKRIPQCSAGLLRRFLAWFGEFDEFLYSDNDIVALMNWEELFSHLQQFEIVHADQEYLTAGIFNFHQPERFEELLGPGALDRAVTAGHFLCRRSPRHPSDLLSALAWMEANPGIAKWHDQALLHVTLALVKWPALNLCKPPHNWASSWAGDFKNGLDLLRTVQVARKPVSHLHYSGGIGTGARPMDEFLFAQLSPRQRNRRLLWALMRQESGLAALQNLAGRAKRRANALIKPRRAVS
jgi:hypothetical protein